MKIPEIYFEHEVKVKLMGKIVGKIKSVDGGFAYFPKGAKNSGFIYESIEDVKDSLQS